VLSLLLCCFNEFQTNHDAALPAGSTLDLASIFQFAVNTWGGRGLSNGLSFHTNKIWIHQYKFSPTVSNFSQSHQQVFNDTALLSCQMDNQVADR
jgi:hypothetical protein